MVAYDYNGAVSGAASSVYLGFTSKSGLSSRATKISTGTASADVSSRSPVTSGTQFSDVSASHWAYNDIMTRAQACTVIMRMMDRING